MKILLMIFSCVFLTSCSANKEYTTSKVAMTKKEQIINSSAKEEEAIKRLTALAIREYEVECEKVKSLRSRIGKKKCTTKAQRDDMKRAAEEFYRQHQVKRTALGNSEG